jgi:hypothetical protein
MPRMTATVVSIALVVLIVFVFVFTAAMNKRARSQWATTEGRVVESRVEARNPPNADRPSIRYGARVVYEYAVAGKAYRAERVSFDGTLWRPTREAAEADRARYAEGAKVSVFYDPERPQSAVLELPLR